MTTEPKPEKVFITHDAFEFHGEFNLIEPEGEKYETYIRADLAHPQEPTPAVEVLDKPAQIASVIFREGVSVRHVIERAQREYEYQNDPVWSSAKTAHIAPGGDVAAWILRTGHGNRIVEGKDNPCPELDWPAGSGLPAWKPLIEVATPPPSTDKAGQDATQAAIELWNGTGEELMKADDVLRNLSSWLGQGGCWDTECLNYEEMEARIREGVETIIRVEVDRRTNSIPKAEPQPVAWMPISSAPTDETIMLGHWHEDDGSWFWQASGAIVSDPLHDDDGLSEEDTLFCDFTDSYHKPYSHTKPTHWRPFDGTAWHTATANTRPDARSDDARDAARLDFLDRLNVALNRQYGTNYGWQLILSPNIVRLMAGRHQGGFVGDIDLNDASGGNKKFTSCREAIDAAIDSAKDGA